jgi:hypothetical protein
MASDPRIRASDADRDRVTATLREHHAAGRLTMEEFQERLDRTYASKTLGELDALLADLPAIDLYQLPIPASQPPAPTARPGLPGTPLRTGALWRAAWASWASVSLVLIVIWLIAGAGYPWFVWPVGIWGAVMAARWIMGVAPHGHDHGHGGRRGG